MVLALPLAVQHEPLMHAWIASLLAHMSNDSAQWREESVIHYNDAVRGLKDSVLVGSPGEEWKRSTALLCHAIELLQPVPSVQLARSHLSAAHCMFHQLTIETPGVPASEHDSLLFEAYIMRTVSNCLVQQDIHKSLPFDYLQKLVNMHQAGLDRLSQEFSPQNCPWVSGLGPDLLVLVYKTSWICIQDPLPDLRRQEAIEVWRSLDGMGEIQEHGWPDQNYDYATARRVYRLACRVLLKPFVFENDPGCATPDIEACVSLGMEELDSLTKASSDDMAMIWPLLVFGAFSTNERQQALCTEIANRLQTSVVTHPVKAVMLFLSAIWESKDNKACFKDSEALRSILL